MISRGKEPRVNDCDGRISMTARDDGPRTIDRDGKVRVHGFELMAVMCRLSAATKKQTRGNGELVVKPQQRAGTTNIATEILDGEAS